MLACGRLKPWDTGLGSQPPGEWLAGVWDPAPWAGRSRQGQAALVQFSGVGSGQSWSRALILCPRRPQEQLYSQYGADRGSDLCVGQVPSGPFFPPTLPSRALLCPCTQGWPFTDGGQSQGEPSMLPWQRSGVTGWGQAGSREEMTSWWGMLWKGAACSLGAPRYF